MRGFKPGGMMRKVLMFNRLGIALLMLAIYGLAQAAKPPPKPPKVAPVVVDSVTVDWVNERLVVRGSGFVDSTSFLLGGSGTLLGTDNVTDAQLEIPFNAAVAAEVTSQGNYNLEANGSVQLSVYIESQIVDPAAAGCPCTPDWITELGGLWIEAADCLEIQGPDLNDIADISGTIRSDYPNSIVYPQYPISASFYPGEPDDSVCRLVEVSEDATVVDLVNKRINEQQQSICATVLRDNVCATVNGL